MKLFPSVIPSLLLTTALTLEAGAAAHLEKIRAAKHDKYVRIVLDLDAAAQPIILEDQGTLIFELESFSTEGLSRSWDNMGAVSALNITRLEDNKARVSFDLEGSVRPRLFTYTPDHYGGHRIVIDLWPIAEPNRSDIADPAEPETKIAANDPIQDETDPEITEQTPEITEIPEQVERIEPVDVKPVTLQGLRTASEVAPAENTKPSESDTVPETATMAPVQLPTFTSPAVEKAEVRTAENVTVTPPMPSESEESDVPEQTAEETPGLRAAAHVADPIGAARDLLADGKAAQACTLLQDRFPRGSWNLDAMILEGRCLAAQEKPGEAAGLYSEILSFDPDNTQARLALAQSQVQMGDLRSARDNYARLLGTLESKSQERDIQSRIKALDKKLRQNAY